MNLRIGGVLASAVALSVGLITLIGILVGRDFGLLSDLVSAFFIREFANIFIRLTVVTVATTIFIGVLNLLSVHVRRMIRRTGGGQYSLILLLSFVLTIVLYIVDAVAGTDLSDIMLSDFQLSIESALAGLVFFSLVYGAYRMMRQRVTWTRILFVFALLIVLIGTIPLPGLDIVATISNWMMAVPVSAGARGILLGIALATLVTGIRVLIGQDRSYRE